jgi:eukaryotic-like serine/threonine-protein kinase
MKPTAIKLTVAQGSLDKKEYVFAEHTRCTIGRAEDCDIQVPRDFGHADVSRHHCALDIDPPVIRVRDLGSRNGTFVNGEKIGQRSRLQPTAKPDADESPARELRDGDEVQVGHTVLRVGVLEDTPRPGSFLPSLFFFV